MANLIIKPTSGGSLILQDEGGTAAHTIDANGNHTLSGSTNNLGTVTAGTLSSGVTFPASHIIGHTGQNQGQCMGSLITADSVGDVVNSGVSITIGSGNKALVLITGFFYTHINHAGADRHISLYKSVNGGGDTEIDEAWQGGEAMKQYERMAISSMCMDNSTGTIVYKLKVKQVGTSGTLKYYTNMFAFEIKG